MGTPNHITWGTLLPSARGMTWVNPYQGRLETSRGVAEVRLDAPGGASIRLEAEPGRTCREALACSAALPLNVRYAGSKHRLRLEADAWVDASSFPTCIAEFRRGVRRAVDGSAASRRRRTGEPETYEQLFEDLDRLDDPIDVVPRPPGWELGPRVRGKRVAVRVSPEHDGLRLHRVVLKRSELGDMDDLPRAESLGDAALRLNHRMRFARLALDATGITLEARLLERLADVQRVLETARAIATVSAPARLELELLARHRDVADSYAHTFHLNGGRTP